MPRKKQISEITLQLTDKQRIALQNNYVTPQGLGINQATYNRWFHDPYFRALWYVLEEAEIDRDEISKYDIEFKAAALVYYGFTYETVENYLSLKSGTIIGWVNDSSKEGKIFRYARAYAEEYDPKLEQKEEAAKADLASKQSLAIPLIVAGRSDQQVADEIGVSRQTILNWRNNDTRFMQELQETKASLRQAQLVTLSKIVDKAFKTVEELLDNPDPKIRLKAALDVLKGTEWKPPK
jgi:transposase